MNKLFPPLKIQSILALNFLLLFSPILINAQAFVNGDLDGTIATSSTPAGWTQVPNTDVVSKASDPLRATSDITGVSGPSAGAGLSGNPQSGTTFVSGLDGEFSATSVYHEGLQQTVTGFTIGSDYTIEFYQAVVKQVNALDQTGSWSVYLDNTLLATTAITTSTAAYNSTSFVWEHRSITFTATATFYTFKFMPTDDDSNGLLSSSSPSGAIRMGIDNISIVSTILSTELIDFNGHSNQNQIELFWETAKEENHDYFSVEHSTDGITWLTLADIDGAGNSSKNKRYSYTHKQPYKGTNYYRLKQTDYGGLASYSKVIAVDYVREYSYSMYPNPARDQVTISIDEEIVGPKVIIYDFVGKPHLPLTRINGSELVVDVSQLSKGLYYLELKIKDAIIRETLQIR